MKVMIKMKARQWKTLRASFQGLNEFTMNTLLPALVTHAKNCVSLIYLMSTLRERQGHLVRQFQHLCCFMMGQEGCD